MEECFVLITLIITNYTNWEKYFLGMQPFVLFLRLYISYAKGKAAYTTI